jgi:hypothetical protein
MRNGYKTMNNKKIKSFIILILTLILLFALYNLVWYFATQSKYGGYVKDMDELFANRSYVLEPGDGYLYNVKYPDYLSLTGNLGVTDEENGVALIIWPSFFGEDSYGVRIATDRDTYLVMVNKDIKAIDSVDDDVIDKYKEEIKMLFQKADNKWGIIE